MFKLWQNSQTWQKTPVGLTISFWINICQIVIHHLCCTHNNTNDKLLLHSAPYMHIILNRITFDRCLRFFHQPGDNVKKSDANPLTEILKNPTKVVLLRVCVCLCLIYTVVSWVRPNVCLFCRTWWAEERWTKTWRERRKKSARNTAKWLDVSFLR